MWTGQNTYFDKKYEILNGTQYNIKLDELEVYLINN